MNPGGGKFYLTASDDKLTAYGGIAAWDHFLEHIQILKNLAQDYPLPRTSPNATPVEDILKSFVLNCLTGGKRFAHVRRLQDDRAVATLLGLRRGKLCGEDTFRRLCAALSKDQARAWLAKAESQIYGALPQNAIADWDSTVTTRYGTQEDTAVGYNPQKPGRRSHHPLVCVIAGTRLAIHMEWRKGNTVSATDWQEAMEKVWQNPHAQQRIKLNRGDIGFGQEKIMAWHECEDSPRPAYLFKLKMTKNVKRTIAGIDWPEWQGAPTEGFPQVAETTLKLHGWSTERRIVVTRRLKPVSPTAQDTFWGQDGDDFQVYVTNLSAEEAQAYQIAELYRQRGDAENVFDELKNQWGFAGFCSSKAVVSECSARLLLLAYNLWSMFVRVAQDGDGHSEAITSRDELLMLPAKVVISGRQKKIKLALGEESRARIRACYQRFLKWLSQTAPQLALSTGNLPGWRLYDPRALPS